MKRLIRTHRAKRQLAHAPITDSAGHEFDSAIYRVNDAGEPILTKNGTFRLKPGKSHA